MKLSDYVFQFVADKGVRHVFLVTGVREGTTLCRVGTALGRPSFVFEIHVAAVRPGR